MIQKFLDWTYDMFPVVCYYLEMVFYILLGSLSIGYFVWTYPHS